MIYGVLNSMTGEFCYVSAGHPGPVHLPAGAWPVILESAGSPIGLAEGPYEGRSGTSPAAGDRLYLYSDGLPEAMDRAGEQFGDDRLLAAIGRARSEPLQEGVTALLGEIERWRGAAGAQDDVSILAVEISDEASPGEPLHLRARLGLTRLHGWAMNRVSEQRWDCGSGKWVAHSREAFDRIDGT